MRRDAPATRRTLSATVVMAVALACMIILGQFAGCSLAQGGLHGIADAKPTESTQQAEAFSPSMVPDYAGDAWAPLNGNVPFFTQADLAREPFETYAALDELGRCGQAFALIGPETMPQATRGSIGMVKPSGWQVARYDWIDGRYLYNRCHLIAFALAGENDNPRNLITGTRSMNVNGMLPFEEQTAAYIDRTGNHVLYRVTPVFEGDDLVASGVLMEAQSVEDGGAGVKFCTWCYNVEPGVVIDYATGNNREGSPAHANEANASSRAEESPAPEHTGATYVINKKTHKIHLPDCPAVADMNENNKWYFDGSLQDALQLGDDYTRCRICNP